MNVKIIINKMIPNYNLSVITYHVYDIGLKCIDELYIITDDPSDTVMTLKLVVLMMNIN